MNSEARTCQNCHAQFAVDTEDQAFYARLQVPAPTFCPRCRMVRRQMFRNERALYKRPCDLCKKSVVSMYAPDAPYTVYCVECYQSDKWDPLGYGREYDFSRPFFEQFSELMRAVPRRALYIDFASASDYTNWGVNLKNCYLVFGGHHYEDCSYASQSIYLTDCADVDFCQRSESCYGSVHLRRCSRVRMSAFSEDCSDSWFLYGCRNCQNCVGCTNLRNASHCIWNEQYTKEEYEKKLNECALDTAEGVAAMREKFSAHTLKFPRKFAWVRNAAGSTGDDLDNVKNCKGCFTASEAENCRYSFFIPTQAKDSYDIDHVGMGAQLTLELVSGFGTERVAFGSRVYYTHDAYYCDDCYNSSNLFGCIGLKKKEYCILNKQYAKDEYEKMRMKIVEQMKTMPYISNKGRGTGNKGILYGLGEFFPPEISPFTYNETVAQEYFSITKADAMGKGVQWKDTEKRQYVPTIAAQDIPARIGDVQDSITNEILECAHKGECNEQCTSAFRIIPQELQFLRKLGIPLPRLCPNCRHYMRLAQRNPVALFHRRCGCEGVGAKGYKNTATHFHEGAPCPNEFETTYVPDSPYIVYCEQCYQTEVA
ncbi:MAG: hypothetical protein HYW65_01240 [Candidatus Liptonbacteria bacterium]|nr:hypothetical protein [Candidatus Liptonbacteria bacterium]MBI3114508.1 hypothetical protein [Candidatus Harrisonbacteria bacterium]